MNAQKTKQTKAQKLQESMSLPHVTAKADVPDAVAQRFEGSAASEGTNGTAGPKGKPRAGRTRRNLTADQAERLNAYVPIDLMTKVRTRCAVERLSLSQVVCDALAAWLAKKPTKTGQG